MTAFLTALLITLGWCVLARTPLQRECCAFVLLLLAVVFLVSELSF